MRPFSFEELCAMPNPRLNPAILLSPVEDGYLAYDPVRDRLHQLNPLAALLTELSDGRRSMEEIRALAGPLVPDDRLGEIDRWVEDGLKIGLLLGDDGEAAEPRELSTADLITLTRRLREQGSFQTAYLCAKRAVELQPQEWDAWFELGEAGICVGKREEARAAYQKYSDAHPEDGEIEHLLIALKGDAMPPRASDRAIQHIYRNFAASYESRMREDLKYVGPERLDDALTAVIGTKGGMKILDLGCGSGLAGVMLRPRAAELTGVDLSPEMAELSRARNIYDRLEVAEITAWLDGGEEKFDLICSCDCLIYFGDLSVIVAAAARRLKPGAPFAFSMERGNNPPFHLTDTGRYVHHPEHVRDAAAKTGLAVAQLNESFLRMEYGEDVMGLYAVLVKPGA
jgi:predicted TPR repeat methyltransferase